MSLLPVDKTDIEEINQATEQTITYVTDHLLLIIILIILVFISFKVVNVITKRLDTYLKKHMRNEAYVSTVQRILNILMKVAIVLIALDIIGVSMSFMITSLIFILAIIAIGMRDFISNISAGMVLLTGNLFNNGDYIEVNGVEGTVQKTELMHTKILTPNNKVVAIPNTQVVLDNIINYNKRRTMRVDIDVYVKYKNDLEKVSKILIGTAKNLEYSVDEKDPFVVVKGLKPYGIHMQVRFFVKNKDYWKAEWNAPLSIKKNLEKENIEFVELNCNTEVEVNT